ncbi:FecR family protein [Mucilaginibacter sp. OK268]|uniref:FecR family protein n=1 Tax=Mucilaginibacter sp. OK268 TaxID=1881048 RepID=UPI000B838B97|nr:FecR domain-containing protein [Mucilaginibacter sp. OK268]
MTSQEIKDLIEKYQDGIASPREKGLLESWYINYARNKSDLNYPADLEAKMNQTLPLILSLEQKTPVKHREIRKLLWPRIAAAALLLIGLSIGGYYLLPDVKRQQTTATQKETIVPGRNKAVLTLANGKQISLTDASNGQVATQQKTVILKTPQGQIIYQGSSQSSGIVQYNTLSTPRGAQWPQIILPDGTRVMLDAASTIRYPVAFTGPDRVVELTGQAYFEVAHHAKQPFKIKVAGMTLEDIGTTFNVDAYPEETATKTTLVDGSVRIVTNETTVILKPGYQAVVGKSQAISVLKADVGEVIAWKNGQTSFQGKTIEEIMRQVSRWYDVDIIYQGAPSSRKFSGGISRRVQLTDLLRVLEFQDLHVQLSGKRIIIKP